MEDATIYHYTDIAGLMGMFSECSTVNPKIILRASSSDYMNDPTERIHCIRVLSDIIKPIETQLGKGSEISELLELIAKSSYDKQKRYLNQYIDPINHYMTISFSTSRDTLPMWGRYAGDGRGIAIGFDLEKLRQSISKETYYCELSYTNGGSCHTWLYNAIKESYDELIGKESNTEIAQKLIGTYLPFFKNQAYEYEKEVRLIEKHKKVACNIKYRESNGLIIPYADVGIDVNCIKEIILGPSGRMIDKWQSVRDFLVTKNAITGSDRKFIKESEIPYINNT